MAGAEEDFDSNGSMRKTASATDAAELSVESGAVGADHPAHRTSSHYLSYDQCEEILRRSKSGPSQPADAARTEVGSDSGGSESESNGDELSETDSDESSGDEIEC